MKLIEPNVEMLSYYMNPLIKVEKIGRICYKSDSEYTEETAIKFINSLITRQHFSVLEHANFVFLVDNLSGYPFKFVDTTIVVEGDNKVRCLMSTNLRAIIEHRYTRLMVAVLERYPMLHDIFIGLCPELEHKDIREAYKSQVRLIDISDIEDIDFNEIKNHFYTTFLFTTDRGVTHEMVRHRIASFTQESTRYCNYSNDKFGNELTFIKPATFDDWTESQKEDYLSLLSYSEKQYMSLTGSGLPAQFARGVLPTDVKTTIAMTANHKEWEHFFNLRSRAKTGAPHPNMKVVANQAEKIYHSNTALYAELFSKSMNK